MSSITLMELRQLHKVLVKDDLVVLIIGPKVLLSDFSKYLAIRHFLFKIYLKLGPQICSKKVKCKR